MSQLSDNYEMVRSSLRQLRDEMVVKMHLASMDLKDEWQKLQPAFDRAEQYAEAVSETALASAHDVERRLRKLREKFEQLSPPAQRR